MLLGTRSKLGNRQRHKKVTRHNSPTRRREIWRPFLGGVVGFTLAGRETGTGPRTLAGRKTGAGPRLAGFLAAAPRDTPPGAGLCAGPAGRAAPGELRPLRII